MSASRTHSRIRHWKEIECPHPWKPEPGEVLEGTYTGTMEREGEFSEYTCYVINAFTQSWYVTGTTADQLFSQIEVGSEVKLVFEGMKKTKRGFERKLYRLYIGLEEEAP